MGPSVVVAGESHGRRLVVTVLGLPCGLVPDLARVAAELARRRLASGRSDRQAAERDRVEVLAGLRGGATLGGPVALSIENLSRPGWARRPRTVPRPGHAELAGALKYGLEDLRDVAERASGRLTAGRVAGAVLFRQLLEGLGVTFRSRLVALGGVPAAAPGAAAAWERLLAEARAARDSLGGVVEVVAEGVPAGLGSCHAPEARLEALLALELLAIPGVKGVEFGDGFALAAGRGSATVDAIVPGPRRRGVVRPTNHAGGVEGGMANGEPIVARLAVKPVPTTGAGVPSVDLATGAAVPAPYERADTCVAPAVAVVAENVMAVPLWTALAASFGGDRVDDLAARVAAHRGRCARALPWSSRG